METSGMETPITRLETIIPTLATVYALICNDEPIRLIII